MLVYQPVDGGVGRHVRDLTEGLVEREYQIVLCGPSLPGDMSELPSHASHVRLDLDRAIAPRTDLAALGKLAEIVRRTKPDVIHAHSSKAGAVARLGRVLQPRTPVVYTPHGYAFAGFFSSRLERLRYREIERALAPLATRVVCVCEAEGRLAVALGSKRRVRVVHNGIEPAGTTPGPIDARMVELRRRGPVICVLTQLRAGKGIETLIDATPSVLASHPDLQVAIWGDGSERETLQSRASSVGVSAAMHFLGPNHDPLSALRGADMLVHPSLAEAFPYVILEAMSVARAIVASDVGGIGEAILGGEDGLLVPAGDSRSLAQAMIDLLDEPERRALMGSAAQLRMERLFNRTVMVDRLAGVYSEVSG
jgi:glycosyltransferase involved in cell wall biosynthesis